MQRVGGSGCDAEPLHPHLERVNAYVMRWMRKKFKRLRGRTRARTAWNQVVV